MSIGESIKQYCKVNNLTFEEFGLKIGVSKTMVSRWVNGGKISSNKYYQICDVLNLPYDTYINENSNYSKSNTPKIARLKTSYNVGFNCVFDSIHDLDTLADFLFMARELLAFSDTKKSSIFMLIDCEITDKDALKTALPIINFDYDNASGLNMKVFTGKKIEDMKIEKESVRRVIGRDIIQNALYTVNATIELDGNGHFIQFVVQLIEKDVI